ncbi:Hypothetical_protein [Hexamita inflata]|uniref:Hypothetical_protein n=1 Tax=Hexamita inflata TaxID=28002 RepID=A0ABP1H8L5_9EUKA
MINVICYFLLIPCTPYFCFLILLQQLLHYHDQLTRFACKLRTFYTTNCSCAKKHAKIGEKARKNTQTRTFAPRNVQTQNTPCFIAQNPAKTHLKPLSSENYIETKSFKKQLPKIITTEVTNKYFKQEADYNNKRIKRIKQSIFRNLLFSLFLPRISDPHVGSIKILKIKDKRQRCD